MCVRPLCVLVEGDNPRCATLDPGDAVALQGRPDQTRPLWSQRPRRVSSTRLALPHCTATPPRYRPTAQGPVRRQGSCYTARVVIGGWRVSSGPRPLNSAITASPDTRLNETGGRGGRGLTGTPRRRPARTDANAPVPPVSFVYTRRIKRASVGARGYKAVVFIANRDA